MAKFIINGSNKLSGEIHVSGSKNALFPLMAACLLTDEVCELTNVPEIKDKETMVEILKDLGVSVEVSPHKLVIAASGTLKTALDEKLAGKLRGSIVLLGPILARIGKASMT